MTFARAPVITVAGLSPVVLAAAYNANDLRTQLAVTIGGVKDLVNDFSYDGLNRMQRVTQHSAAVAGQPTPNAVAEKRVDFAYNAASQFDTITRFANLAGTQVVASSVFHYDPVGRLDDLTHRQAPSPGNPGEGGGEGSVIVNHHYAFDAANRITRFVNSVDGSTDYGYDSRDQLTAASPSSPSPPAPSPESYSYDSNGNPTNSGVLQSPAGQTFVTDSTGAD